MECAPFPSADHFARAIVEACRITGEDPRVFFSAPRVKARPIALAGLAAAYTEAPVDPMARCLGYAPNAGSASLYSARRRPSWREEAVDEVCGALVAPLYGSRAA